MENWLPNISGKPPEAAVGKKVDIMLSDGYVVEGTDTNDWFWFFPHEGCMSGESILAWRLSEVQEPARESHVALASLHKPIEPDAVWMTGWGFRGGAKFYLHFDTVDGKVDLGSIRATEVQD